MATTPTRRREDPLDRALVDVLRLARTDSKLRDQEIADRAGLPKAQLNRILNYSAPIEIGPFMRICEALGRDYAEVAEEAKDRLRTGRSS